MKTIFISLFFIFPALIAAQSLDSTAIKQVDSLIQVARTLTSKQDYVNAIETAMAAEKLALEKMGRETNAYGNACFMLCRLHYLTENFAEAEIWGEKAREAREKTLGKDHPDYAAALNLLGLTCRKLGKYEQAEPLLLESKTIRGKALGKEHADYATSLNSLGLLYMDMRKFTEAEQIYLEALAVRGKILGKEHPDYASSLSNLALLYLEMEEFQKAEPLFLEAIAIREKALGKNHPGNAVTLSNLARVYQYLGQYEKAEALLLDAIAIQAKALGKTNSVYAESLNMLAALYQHMGDYEASELMFLEVRNIFEKVLGKKHPKYGLVVHNLSSLCRSLGNYEKAEFFICEAMEVQEQSVGKETQTYAVYLMALASIYFDKRDFEKVEPLLLEAKALMEKTIGKEDLHYAGCLSALAATYRESAGNNSKAEPLMVEALAIVEKKQGKSNADYAYNLMNLGELYISMDLYEKAAPFYFEALRIYEKVLGKEHPRYLNSLDRVRFYYLITKQWAKAEEKFQEREVVFESVVNKALRHLSEREINQYLSSFTHITNSLCLFARTAVRESRANTHIAGIVYDNLLFSRSLILNFSIQTSKLIKDNPATAEKFNLLKACGRNLAIEYSKPISERKGVAGLEEKANEIEKELARSVAGYAEATRQVKWQDVQATLKAGDAAIEFVHFNVNFPIETDSILYAALVLLPGTEQPQFIPLFEAKQLEAMLKPADKQKVDWVNQLYAETSKDQTSLYELLWKPLEPALSGVQTIYFSPAGQLHRLNLGAIAMPPMLRGQSETSTLGERFRLIEVGSTRLLVTGSGRQAPGSGNQAMLFGGIQYELDTSAMDQARPELENSSITSRSRGLDFASTDSTLRGGKWEYLPWTKVEVTALDGILTKAGIKATMQKDYEASEEAFKSLGVNQPSPRILHLATHGFFFPDPKTTVDGGRSTVDGDEPVFKMSDHPMIRSGLLMAGGNYAWEKGKPFKPEAEDGILTAYEISQMNLSNTELVVLSACETGLGDIQGNEGVYGLQRAFKIAGAKYLIMSLWQVPDFQTQQLMSAFYRNWLQDKMSIPDAFRAAQQAMQLKFKYPFFWAGFVLVE